MLFLRLDQALQLLRNCKTLKEPLAIRYMTFNGLSPMEIASARIEHLDPTTCELFLPKRHKKRNCITIIDKETVKLQIIYSNNRKKGPLLVSRKTHGHLGPWAFWALVQRVAKRTFIANKQLIGPLILKRTYARLYLKTPGNTIAGLKKSFSHKKLSSTAHYLIFVLDDVRQEKQRMMRRIEREKTESVRSVP